MAAKRSRKTRDVEKNCSRAQFVRRLRRLADAIEAGKPFRIRVAGETVDIPADAVAGIEHERGVSAEEIEFQLRWTRAARVKS